jgi:signal transduction histidine kinase
MEDLPLIQGDPEALKKVFYHLISNAIKYTPDGGKIVVSGFLKEHGDPKFPPGGVEIILSDTGIGIDPRFKDLIFTKFYQTGELALHSSGKTKFKGGGPGLGLAIVRGIVEAHGGKVWAESSGYDEENMPGSHFHVVLPAQSKDEVTEE